MISIDLVYKTVLALANSDIRGNSKPSEIRLFINKVINEIYEEYLPDLNRMLNRQNKGLIGRDIENIPDRIREKLNHFLVENKPMIYKDGYFVWPSDLRFIDAVFCNEVEVENTKSNSEFNLVKKIATNQYPVYNKYADQIKIAPSTIIDKVTISYLRNPKIPKWTYFVANGTEIYNPSALDFQDIDLHKSEFSNVVLKTLQLLGINLKEQDLQQITMTKENIEFNQENAN
ncbi:hypothetical protein [Flavobacterium sp. HSC-61S13]|uniref:hypothetical protein n=1 Tax=Flavobacterium sp. HSC-61S13 TaxID=2910963 RepID=UPI0020A207C6|nr:hypothetical protein [Flavobacterium sp. HSC-61S13]MCP1996653.1 outer membrane lipoprotein-sorting protein [Flavobacterium sp. HSC-61S13]